MDTRDSDLRFTLSVCFWPARTIGRMIHSKATPPEAKMPNCIRSVGILICLCVLIAPFPLAVAAPGSDDKPNIVLVLMDNFGYGEIGVYGGGILRGAPTPRIDSLATEGFQLTNFNVVAGNEVFSVSRFLTYSVSDSVSRENPRKTSLERHRPPGRRT